jgi:hypothetical protein
MARETREDIEALAEVLNARFASVAVRTDYGWPGRAALNVLDCVLSLNRHYDRVVYPRVAPFGASRAEGIELSHLQTLMESYREAGDFCKNELNYNDQRREQTLRGVVQHLLTVQSLHPGLTEQERLELWAASVCPSDYTSVCVKGFGLAGFQYMRMLFGVQTTKPDIHIIRFVSQVIGRTVNDLAALTLLEQAALKVGLPLREVDGMIWEAGARSLS